MLLCQDTHKLNIDTIPYLIALLALHHYQYDTIQSIVVQHVFDIIVFFCMSSTLPDSEQANKAEELH